MMSRTAFCSAQPAAILPARNSPMPETSRSRSGSASMISKVASPKAATIRLASLGPMPRTMPEPRYFSMPSAVVGGVVLRKSALNCSPCVAVGDPDADGVDELAGGDRRRMADDGDEIALAPRLHLQDGEAVVLVVEGHALDRADERFLGRGRVG